MLHSRIERQAILNDHGLPSESRSSISLLGPISIAGEDMSRWLYSRKALKSASSVWRSHKQTPGYHNTQCIRSISTEASKGIPPRIVFSGIQPTGVPHLGNLLGALRPWVKLQNTSTEKEELFFSIVDLHALTVPQDPKQLKERRLDTYTALLAVGLDPQRSKIFFQSEVSRIFYSFTFIIAHPSRCEDMRI
jgi:tRNA synthetases class I (W and Y)